MLLSTGVTFGDIAAGDAFVRQILTLETYVYAASKD